MEDYAAIKMMRQSVCVDKDRSSRYNLINKFSILEREVSLFCEFGYIFVVSFSSAFQGICNERGLL